MIGSKRKYLSEFGVNLWSARWLMASASQFSSGGTMDPLSQEISNNCHIYLICKMPSFSFVKETFEYADNMLKGELIYSVNGVKRLLPFQQNFPLLDGATKVKLSDYPHREVSTLNDEGEEIRYLPASAISMGQGMHLENSELSSLEVLYVGQAYGEGNRSAFDRLKSHSTLQKILAEAQYNSPDSEIYVLTFEYAPYRVITQMDGRAAAQISDERDSDRFFSILDNPLTEHQQICLAEAGLIRYFQPKYNAIYKDSFPNQKHKILAECYHLDFSALIVELNTDELRFSLFSEKISSKDHHMCNIDLVHHEDRWGFFHLATGDGEAIKFPNVITGT
jgi:hypothetical protein